MMLKLYTFGMRNAENLLQTALLRRQHAGKESPERLEERKGIAGIARPAGGLIWLHAASVGEAQSALALLKTIRYRYPKSHVLVTTGTLTSAAMMEKNLPDGAFHQFYPVDHPDWVTRFLDHWHPDLILWMESELWPNMLLEIQQRAIPAVLINARLSPVSFRRWRLFKNSAAKILQSFTHILCQTQEDADYYAQLGAQNVTVTDNLKYSATALPASESDLHALSVAIHDRPCWVYASSHASEELIAARLHMMLKASVPDLLSVIVPRHPERREDIAASLSALPVNIQFRGEDKTLPQEESDLYIADTMGELGLFYRACPVAVIGRSLSDDGGGGHNPIEAAQLNCAVLHGPHVQNLQEIFDDMDESGAALRVSDEEELGQKLHDLLTNRPLRETQQQKARDFARSKEEVLERIMEALTLLLEDLALPKDAL